MEKTNIKALYIVVNAGFSDDIVELTRELGAGGATIINTRGTGSVHKAIFGISIDTEKEMILTLVSAETADKIVDRIKEKAGLKSPAGAFCFVVPVEKMIGGHNQAILPTETKE